MDFLSELFLNESLKEDCPESDAHAWHDKTVASTKFYLYEFTLELLLKSVLTCYVMYIVICKLKLKERFLVAIPILLQGAFCLTLIENIKSLFVEYDIYDLTMLRLSLVQAYLIIMTHWIFIFQYFKTSLVIPLMLINAKVSIELDEFEEGQLGGAALI